MLNRLSIVVMTLLLGALIAGGVVAQRDDRILILRDGDEVEDEFDEDVTTRLYVFHAREGDMVTITMEQATDELDPFLILLGPEGEVLAADDDSGEEVLLSAAIIDFEIPEDGSYFVMATSFFFRDGYVESDAFIDSDLPYFITIEGNTERGNEGPFEFLGSRLRYDERIEASISNREPVFYFTFNADEGDVIDIFIDSTDFSTIMHVFDPSGDRIIVEPSAVLGFELPRSGTYLVFATDIFFYNAVDFNTRAQENLTFVGGDFTLLLRETP